MIDNMLRYNYVGLPLTRGRIAEMRRGSEELVQLCDDAARYRTALDAIQQIAERNEGAGDWAKVLESIAEAKGGAQ